jgi:hypothetical protein
MADEVVTTAPAVAAPVVAEKPSKVVAPVPVLDALREALAPTKKEREAGIKAKAEAKGANEVLKAAGVKKSDRARMLEELKAGRVELSAVKQQAAAAAAKVEAVTAEAAALTPYVDRMKKYADTEFAGLPESFQKTLAAMKLDDPMKRLDMIDLWRANGVLPAGTAAAVVPVVESKGPANTTAATNPTAPKNGATLTHAEQWKAMKAAGQDFAAAQFYNLHRTKISEQTK